MAERKWFVLNSAYRGLFTEQDLDLSRWIKRGDVIPLSGGRGGSFLFEAGDSKLVIRHYLRGGWIKKIFYDRYLWLGEDNTRPGREARVAAVVRDHGIQTPEIVAYGIERFGIWYRAAIVSRYLPNQGTLAEKLKLESCSRPTWQQLGQLLSQMHAAGVYHDDLNANNILMTQSGGFAILDFDKAELRESPDKWGRQNLDRLKRSLLKIAGQQQRSGEPFHFSEEDWLTLYQSWQYGAKA